VLPDRVEWPTVVVAAAIAVGFGAVLVAHEHLPLAVELAALALHGAWYNSLQHEVIHGHPTPWAGVNTALAAAPLGLVVPFSVYRRTHLEHHAAPHLTDPLTDPESFRVPDDVWARSGPLRRRLLRVSGTLAGRMALGPPSTAVRLWGGAVVARRDALVHAAGVAAVVLAVWVSGLPLWVYALGVAWLGGSLSLLRSFAEHRLPPEGTASAVVRTGPLLSVLFLNNNLHYTHHARPGLPWYRLPAAHRALDGDRAAAAGAGLYDGYGEVARRYLFRPLDGTQPFTPRDVA
jgi:fatty acid desaturase